jgi:hypothetical protein
MLLGRKKKTITMFCKDWWREDPPVNERSVCSSFLNTDKYIFFYTGVRGTRWMDFKKLKGTKCKNIMLKLTYFHTDTVSSVNGGKSRIHLWISKASLLRSINVLNTCSRILNCPFALLAWLPVEKYIDILKTEEPDFILKK